MQIGEGGYRSQTVESISLENGKTANFSVTLSRLGSTGKGRAGRTTATASTSAEHLASETEMGGPVLFAANMASGGQAPITSSRRYQSVPQILSSPAAVPSPGPATVALPVPMANAPAPTRRPQRPASPNGRPQPLSRGQQPQPAPPPYPPGPGFYRAGPLRHKKRQLLLLHRRAHHAPALRRGQQRGRGHQLHREPALPLPVRPRAPLT